MGIETADIELRSRSVSRANVEERLAVRLVSLMFLSEKNKQNPKK